MAAVAGKLTDFLTTRQAVMSSISQDIDPLMGSISNLVTGGKRLRALMCYWGWRGAGGEAGAGEVVTAGSALELFQAAALIHDDIIDRSDTRRGGPSVHRRFSELHEAQGWALDSERFGHAAAILTGDLCLSFSEESFTEIGQSAASGSPARLIFNLMRAEVMAGQYLDILEEVAGPRRDRAGAVSRAQSIIRFKSAKYSTEHPLALGGALAGAGDELLRGYSAFALPLGEAFQLRDDVLGVFGDPVTTGKPAGDDLREGKRTVLVAFALDLARRPNPSSSTPSWAAPISATRTSRRSGGSSWTAVRSRPRKYSSRSSAAQPSPPWTSCRWRSCPRPRSASWPRPRSAAPPSPDS